MAPVVVDLNTVNWEALLGAVQRGSGPFAGRQFQRGGQRGRGLGGILATLLKMIPTFFASTVGQEVLNTGKSVVSDVIAGKSVKGALKEHGRQSVRNLTGLGRRRKPIKGAVALVKPSTRRHHLSQHVKIARRQVPKGFTA